MTSNERRRIEAEYREPVDARRVIAKCAAGLLVVMAIAASGAIVGGVEDSARAAFSVPQVATGR
jgi:hypothetical protein